MVPLLLLSADSRGAPVVGITGGRCPSAAGRKGLDYYVLREVYSEEEAGVVVDQEPKPSSIRKSGVGEKVGLIVSKGRELAQVPDVRGQTQAGAAAVLAQRIWRQVHYGKNTIRLHLLGWYWARNQLPELKYRPEPR